MIGWLIDWMKKTDDTTTGWHDSTKERPERPHARAKKQDKYR